MSNYKASIHQSGDSFYALVVRVDYDGCTQVDCTYKGRHFATRKAAERSTAQHIAKHA